MKKSFILFTAALSLLACTRIQEIEIPNDNLSIFAKTESPAESKTVVESGVHVFWEPGDEIAVFWGEKSAKFTTDITAASGTATFKGTFGNAVWPEDLDLWAVYPFSADAAFDGETITTTLPSEQIAREGSFGKDMNLSIAHSNSSTLQFYNVGGGIRFSVTEEGIKKVMFEGLSNEIISGKVKIGFENGLPVVKEVTGGSQFITLLPPAGKETFEKDTWYYIVAIPGALEGGYKLRFYKDSDYARKVSEKAVVIKRSIYGSLEKADEGIEYESTMMHYPETENDWVESLSLTEYINNQLDSKFNGLSSILEDEHSALTELNNIEGIAVAVLSSDKKCLSIMQKDSIIVHHLLDAGLIMNQASPTSLNTSSSHLRQIHTKASKARSRESWFNNGISALVLAPVYGTIQEQGATLDSLVDALRPKFDDRITVLKGPDADLTKFYGDYLDDYDFIYINTHGGIIHKNSWFWEHLGELFSENHEPLDSPFTKRTALATGTKYDEQFFKDYIDNNILNKYSLYIMDIGDETKNEHDLRVSMTPEFLEESPLVRDEASFDNTVVMIGACHSAEIPEGEESLMEAFLKKGAAIFSGYTDTMNSPLNAMISFRMVSAMMHGFSFQEAASFIIPGQHIKDYCETIDRWYHDFYNEQKYNDSRQYIKPSLFSYKFKEGISLPYRFIDPYPLIIEASQQGEIIDFRWKSLLRSYTETWPYYFSGTNNGEQDFRIVVSYDIFVDGVKQEVTFGPNVFTDKSATWIPSSSGEHSWYVVATIMDGDAVLASYQSEEGTFTIREEPHFIAPEPIDLGLPSGLKWASFNLGAKKAEESGDYFTWGETEPYYSSLDPLTWKPDKQYGYSWMYYKWAMGSEKTLTKYNSDAEYGYNGFTDGKYILEPEDDAAHINLGDKWRMPTDYEWEELTSKCSFAWTSQNGVNGCQLTGPNGNSIFIPAAGFIYWSGLSYNGTEGYYWSLTGYKEYPDCSYGFWFHSTGTGCCSLERCFGFTIRPVYGDRKIIPSGDIEGTEEDPWN